MPLATDATFAVRVRSAMTPVGTCRELFAAIGAVKSVR